jgi:hypothetical protein
MKSCRCFFDVAVTGFADMICRHNVSVTQMEKYERSWIEANRAAPFRLAALSTFPREGGKAKKKKALRLSH